MTAESKPPTNPPPPKRPAKPRRPPTKPPKKGSLAALIDARFAEVVALIDAALARFQSPARRDLTPTTVRTVATPGGPVQSSVEKARKEPTPGSAAATATAVRESAGERVGDG